MKTWGKGLVFVVGMVAGMVVLVAYVVVGKKMADNGTYIPGFKNPNR